MSDGLDKKKILVVDDAPENISVLMEILKFDFRVVPALNGEKALSVAQKDNPPDIILLDVMMPGMDGYEVCKKLKADGKTKNIPVIFITSKAEIDDIVKGFELGAVDYVTKPFNPRELLSRVNNHLDLKRAREEIEELMRHRSVLTDMIVHDVNNLLTITLGRAYFIKQNKNLPESDRENAALIEKSAKGIQFMVRSLLDVEKLESGTLPVSIESVNILEIIKERSQLLNSQAEENGITLKSPETNNDNSVLTDKDLIARVLDNIIFNAIKFCPKNGSIEINVNYENNKCFVAITNDGETIPREYHERIFEKFAQVEVRKGTQRKGVGLGLTFCKMAMEAMNGAISVRSPVESKEDGVKFIISLQKG